MVTWAGKGAFATAAKRGGDSYTIEDYSVALAELRGNDSWGKLDTHEMAVAKRMLTSFMDGGGIIESELISVFDYVNKAAESNYSNTTEKDRNDTRDANAKKEKEKEKEVEEDKETEVEDAVGNTEEEEETEEDKDKETEKETNSNGFSDAWNKFLGESGNNTVKELDNQEINALFEALPDIDEDSNNRKYVSADALAKKLGLKNAEELEDYANITIYGNINKSEFLEIIRAYDFINSNDKSDSSDKISNSNDKSDSSDKISNSNDTSENSGSIDYNSGYRSYEEMKKMLKIDDNKTIDGKSDDDLIGVFDDDFRYKVLSKDQGVIDKKIEGLNADGTFDKADYTELDNFVDNLILTGGKANDLAKMIDDYNERTNEEK